MAGTFADFVAASVREEIVLGEVSPSVTLRGWTAVGDESPDIYTIALLRTVGADVFPGGLYQRVIAVQEDATVLTRCDDLAALEAAASGWYWDEANGVLYAKRPSGGSPDAAVVYQATVTLYLATAPVVLPRVDDDPATAVYYQPWLTGPVPGYLSEVEDILFGAKTTPTGDLEIANGHGLWHRLLATDGVYNWKNKKVRFLVGGRYAGLSLTRSQYAAITTMEIEDVACDEERARFTLKPLARRTERTLPVTPYFETDYPNLGEGVRGAKKWIGYGRATIRPDLTDASGHGVWTIADAAFQTLYAVHSVAAVDKVTGVRSTLSVGDDYSVDLTACTVTILTIDWAWEDYDLEVDVTGKPGGARGYLSTFAEIVEDLLVTFLGAADDEIDATAFTRAQADNPAELSMWLKRERSIASLLATAEDQSPCLERSVMGTVQQTLAGLWTCWIWDPSVDLATVVRLGKADFARFQPQPKLETVFAATDVYFAQNHARDEWAIERRADPRIEYLAGTTEPASVYTFLRGATDAQILAQRYQLISGAISTEVEFAERGAKLAQAKAGDKVLITYDPAPSATGRYESRAFEILRLEKGYAPTMTIAGRFGDLRGIGLTVGHWHESEDAAWADAPLDQRSRSGYWTDSQGRIDADDPETAGLSRWW